MLRWEWARERHGIAGAAPGVGFIDSVAQWIAGGRTVWTAHQAETPVGMVCLSQFERMPSPAPTAGGRWGYLGHLYVLPAARECGFGRALIEQVLSEARLRRYSKIVLSPTELSIPLYERCGFTQNSGLMLWRPRW